MNTPLLLIWGFVAGMTSLWLGAVTELVPQPYLDEVFHLPQAQAYCARQWQVWDPKLTTPPGLYLVSYVLSVVTRQDCNVVFLRSQNAVLNSLHLPFLARQICMVVHDHGVTWPDPSSGRSLGLYAVWTAINVSLFPILFFFSALYYTDVASTFSVLLCYSLYLQRTRPGLWGWPCHARVKDALLVLCSLFSLSFRQTNIFWVAAFLGGLEMVRTLQSEAPPEDVHDSTFSDVVARSWSLGQTYDPPAGDAHLEDYLKTGLSLAVATCASIGKAIRALLPYLTVLASFAGFVAWNGGVVLGDKSNHIMTLHLPQMLYIWAFFMFFSFPILSSSLVDALIPANALPKLFRSSSRPSAAITLRQASIIVTAISLMLMIVHFNTFAHPFTLSDNRHYVFYIFRWFLLRHAVFKYLATPVYLLCGWSVIGALGERRAPSTPGKIPKKPAKSGIRQREHSLPVQGNRVSFVIIWLLSTSLALVTVPLVEPRYFIVPWVIWRLHVPSTITPVGEWVNERLQGWWPTIPRVDIPRLALETLWFMLLNFITGYVFLYRGFEWPQEPGLVQRFMW